MKIELFLSFFCLSFSLSQSEEMIGGDKSCKVLFDAHDRAAMFSRNFVSGQSNRWPNGVVPYTISSSFSLSQKDVIMDSIKHITDRTCVKFVERTDEANYVDIFTGQSGCYANLGYNQNRQRSVVHLQSNGCVYLGIVVHELLHILGFGHEQTRSDRDQFITINWSNIRSGTYGNFWRALGENEAATIPYCGNVGIDRYDNCYAGFRASTFGIAYDYGSIMHYGLNYFTNNGQNTMTLKQSTTASIPNRRGMSSLDIAKTQAAYGCQSQETTQGPSTTAPETTTTTAPACQDTWNYCSYYTSYCGRHSYINRHCKRTCFNCVCENKMVEEGCAMLKDYCSFIFVRNLCLKQCGIC